MLSHQGVALFQSIRRCGLVGGAVLLGVDFKVSKAQTWPSGSLFRHPPSRCNTLSYFSSNTSAYADNGLDVEKSRPSPINC